MSPDSYFDDNDDIPDFIKEIMKNFVNQFKSINQEDLVDIFKKINEVDPSEYEDMFKKMFGEDFVEKLGSLGENIFGGKEDFDPKIFSNIKQFKFDFNNLNFTSANPKHNPVKDITVEENAYFEFVEKSENEIEIIVDLPGITDQRQINWEIFENKLKLSASTSGLKYHAIIPLPDGAIIQKHLSRLNNSVYILPFRKE